MSLSEFTPYLVRSYTNNSPKMDSGDTSTYTVFHTISQFNNSDIENPDEFADSEPSPSPFSQPPFQPLHNQVPDEPSSVPSSYTDATPIFSPMTSDPPEPSCAVDEELENDLDNFFNPTTTTPKP